MQGIVAVSGYKAASIVLNFELNRRGASRWPGKLGYARRRPWYNLHGAPWLCSALELFYRGSQIKFQGPGGSIAIRLV